MAELLRGRAGSQQLSPDRENELLAQVERLTAENERIRHAASVDIQNAHNQNVALARQLTKAKNELIRQREEEPEHDQVRTLLLHWKHAMAKNAKTDIGAGSKRHRIVKRSIERWGFERCRNAIDGLALIQHVGPRGRSAKPYPGSSVKNDIWHAFGEEQIDEGRFERCEAVFEESRQPTLEVLLELESETRQIVREIFGEDCTLPYKPASKDPAPSVRAWEQRTPVERVLSAIPDARPAANNPDFWAFRCPVHDDQNPSGWIQRGASGRVKVGCFAGCDMEEILTAFGLELDDLWRNYGGDSNAADYAPATGVSRENAETLRLIENYLRRDAA